MTPNRRPFSLSKQPLTAFAILSYGKRDFAEAEGRKTEIGERCTRRRRGGGRGKKFYLGPERRNLAKETETVKIVSPLCILSVTKWRDRRLAIAEPMKGLFDTAPLMLVERKR